MGVEIFKKLQSYPPPTIKHNRVVISSKRKHKLYDKFLKKRTYKNEIIYKSYKCLFEKLKFKSKQLYYKNLINKYKNNIKKTWSIIKEVINKTNTKRIFYPVV